MARIEFHPLGPGDWPITSGWRTTHRPGHRGADVGVWKQPLYASVTGTAATGSEPGGAGWWVNITGNGVTTKCFHMSRVDVTNGQHVTAGQQIGVSGGVPGEPGAGNTTGAHLHYEIWQGGVDTDPVPDLQAVEQTTTTEPPTEDEMTPEQFQAVIDRIDGAGTATRDFLSERLEQVAAADRVKMSQAVEAVIDAVVRADADNATEEDVTRKRDELLAVVRPQLDRIEAG